MKRKGFTLIEILIAFIIIGILASMATAFFSSDYKKQKQCIENLETMSKAIEKYRDATGQYPPDATSGTDSLKGALYPTYIPDANVFKCPVDTTDDSYSKFYVKRNDYSNMAAFTLGCPRHKGNKSAMNLFFQGQTMKQTLAAVNNGTLKPGDTFGTGTITFADGSTASITEGRVVLLQSFNTGNGKCYSLLKTNTVPTAVVCNVIPGSKFEVITPSAIAGVGGTTFTVVVEAGTVAGTTKTTISVNSGIVAVGDKKGRGRIVVKENESVEVEEDEAPKKRHRNSGGDHGEESGERRGRGPGRGDSD